MQNSKDLYKELAVKITDNIPQVRWVDIWNSQVYHLERGLPFPTPAVFLAFRSSDMTDLGIKVQNVSLQIDVFLFYETFSNTYHGSFNQEEALQFLDTLDNLNKLLHGSSGENYSNMRRVSFSPVDTGGAGNLYSVTYNCTLIDYSAAKEWEKGQFKDIDIQPEDNNFIIRI